MIKLEEIMDSPFCYGCGACVSKCPSDAISMRTDEKGFSRPWIHESKCTGCNLCYQVCPAVETNRNALFAAGPGQAGVVWSVRNRDNDIRRNSSSGGLFTALSDYVLAQGGVVCGAVWRDGLSVGHICASNADDRDRMRQSKYVQSDMGSCFRDILACLKAGKTVLFTGTPCQTGGLRLFLGDSDTRNLILCDVLCGGNVSPGLFKDYISYIEKIKKDRAVSVCFRTKKYGWKEHHIRVELKDKTYEGARRENEPFFTLYLSKYSIRDSCFSCGFASKERISDITMGDFWGIDKAEPEIDDDIGISLAIVNTEKGAGLMERIGTQVYAEQRNMDMAVPRQINLRSAPVPPKNRGMFWDEYARNGGACVLRKYTTFGLAKKIRFKCAKALRSIGLRR